MEITRENLLTLIQSAIKRLGLSISGLEKDAHVPKDTIRDFLRGKTQILRADKLQKILRVIEPEDTVPISGSISVGGEIIFAHETDGKKNDKVVCPPNVDPGDVVAIRIRGDGMLPIFHDGWVIYYSRRNDIAIPPIEGGWQVPYNKTPRSPDERFAEYLGKPCVIGLTGDRTFVGILKRSLRGKGYDLTNHNGADLTGIMPVWAARIIFIKTA